MYESSMQRSDVESTGCGVAAEHAGDATPESPPVKRFGLKVRSNVKTIRGEWEWG